MGGEGPNLVVVIVTLLLTFSFLLVVLGVPLGQLFVDGVSSWSRPLRPLR
jgi:hypothetical protein